MPDDDRFAEIAAEIEELSRAAEQLRKLGVDHDLPAVEKNAERVEGVAAALEDNVPPELYEE